MAKVFVIRSALGSAKHHRTAQPAAARTPSHYQSLQGEKFSYGVGCQIRRQAGHGATHSLAT